jgi:hypothetical protein
MGDIVMPHDMVILETYQGSFIHLSEKINEDYEMIEESQAVTTLSIANAAAAPPKKVPAKKSI